MTTTAKKTKAARKLSLTSRAKMGAARKAKPARKPAGDLKAALAASIEAVVERVEPVIATTGLDGDAGPAMESIGEVVQPVAKALTESECAAAGDAWINAKDGRLARYYANYQRVYEAIKAGDGQDAARVMYDYLREVQEDFLRY